MRLEKAMEPHTLIAFKLNGKDLPLAHGAPVRLMCRAGQARSRPSG
jgi:DMSO/TMAO reductase YedYZ molybdopterin-dependent catalytic subunit